MRSTDDTDYINYAEANRTRLRQTAYLICGDWDRAEDATQEALARLYVHWRRIDRTAGLRSYAHRAVVSAVIDAGRRAAWRRERPSAEPPDRPASRTPSVEDQMVVVEALATLPPRQRACVVLRYYQDLTVHETALALNVHEGTVKSQTARGLATLKTALLAEGFTQASVSKEATR